MRVCREASRTGEGGPQGDGFPGADFAGDDAEGVLADAPADPGGGLGVGAVAVQHARGQVAPERHLGEPVVGLEFLDTHCASWMARASSMVIWPGSWRQRASPRPAKLMAAPASRASWAASISADVVDAGRGSGRDRLLGAGLGVGVTADDVRDRLPGRAALPAHLDTSQVERVEDQLDPAAGEGRVDLVGVAVQRHRRGLADGAALAPQERLVQPGGFRQWRCGAGPAVRPSLQWGLPGLRMPAAVVDGAGPRGEQPVQLADAGHVPPTSLAGIAGELDQELLPHGEEQPLDLPPALGPARGAVGQLDAQHRAGAQQPRIDERGPVVDVDPVGDAVAGQRGPQCGGEADGVFRVAEPVPGDQP